MGDIMLYGALRMPYEMAMGDELSRHQYWQRAQQALDELTLAKMDAERYQWAIAHPHLLEKIIGETGSMPCGDWGMMITNRIDEQKSG